MSFNLKSVLIQKEPEYKINGNGGRFLGYLDLCNVNPTHKKLKNPLVYYFKHSSKIHFYFMFFFFNPRRDCKISQLDQNDIH